LIGCLFGNAFFDSVALQWKSKIPKTASSTGTIDLFSRETWLMGIVGIEILHYNQKAGYSFLLLFVFVVKTSVPV
jgi:hypothetical protein